MYIAIMQGRLVPPTDGRIQCFPRERWRDEFALAAAAGLDAIEWIYDLHGADVNPVGADDGLEQVRTLSTQRGVLVRSLCADYFMDKPLLRAEPDEIEERTATLRWLLARCASLGAGRVVLPFVDASRIDSDAELDHVVGILGRVLPVLEETGVELHLETSLPPHRLARLLARLPHAMLKVNYDSGNSASMGYDPADEFAAYGTRVGSVHIKDRVIGGGTVPLGSGNTDFKTLFKCLGELGYTGDFVLQVARGASGDEVAWARSNRDYVLALHTGVA
ncbi:MAG: sugar phosphate isomerase/epimerase family protein [Candidatus Limnocylindrales bacterium]